jgi:hypothetical protein
MTPVASIHANCRVAAFRERLDGCDLHLLSAGAAGAFCTSRLKQAFEHSASICLCAAMHNAWDALFVPCLFGTFADNPHSVSGFCAVG